MEPKNCWFVDVSPFPMGYFQVPCWFWGGVSPHFNEQLVHLQEWRPGKSYEPIFETILASSSVSSLGGDLLTIDP